MTKSSDQPGENERYINRSLSLDGIGEAGCILKYAEAYTIAPSPPDDFPRAFIVVVDCTPPRTRRRRHAIVAPPHSWTKSQNPAKNWIEKFVNSTDCTCPCNDLTSFEYEVQAITGNGS